MFFVNLQKLVRGQFVLKPRQLIVIKKQIQLCDLLLRFIIFLHLSIFEILLRIIFETYSLVWYIALLKLLRIFG